MKTIGILALQGAVQEHADALLRLPGIRTAQVKTAAELKQIDGLILPGGESTAMGRLLHDFQLLAPLRQAIQSGLPVWGTCAGMILLAKKIEGRQETYLDCMDITVKRNAYGSQLDSFQTEAVIPAVSAAPIPLVFIRAPYIVAITSGTNQLLAIDGKTVAAEQDNMLVTSFHPELTKDLNFHQYFVQRCVK